MIRACRWIMSNKSLRLGLLVAMLTVSLHATAAPRYWTLTGVQFEDEGVATGYFSYDVATGTYGNWNLRVSGGAGPFIPWTYVPVNSWGDLPGWGIYSGSTLAPPFWWRQLYIVPSALLDGSRTTVLIDLSSSESREAFVDDFGPYAPHHIGPSRKIISGSLTLTASPPATIIDAGFTGSWYNPALSGHGLFIEVLPENRMLVTWATFSPTGEQAWFYGVGTYQGNTATISGVDQPTGGRWIPNVNSAHIVHNQWGSLTLTFIDCNYGRVDFNSIVGYGSGFMNLTRLTQPLGSSCFTNGVQ